MSYTAGQKLRATQMSMYVCTSATRPDGHTGQLIYETDTDAFQVYNGSAWVEYGRAGNWLTSTPTLTNVTGGTVACRLDNGSGNLALGPAVNVGTPSFVYIPPAAAMPAQQW